MTTAQAVDGRRVALVTGGSRGIGRAIVDAFLAADIDVVTCGRSPRPADLPGAVVWIEADLLADNACHGLAAAAIEAHGGVDILVNNAGVQVEKTVDESTDADWELIMGLNMRAVFRLCRALIPHFASRGGGNIINIGSISGHVADPGMALYDASKAFVHGLTRAMAVDHGAEGIRCNAICPGWIMTGMAAAGFALARDPERARADALARHAVGRFGVPADVAAAALWLADPKSNFITGQTFTVDGGLTAASPLNPGLF